VNRENLENLIRLCGQLTNEYEFVVIGSQAILGTDPNPPAVLTASMEADIYPLNNPELADQIDGAYGEGSHFHDLNGYYAEGVGAGTAYLPEGWKARVQRLPLAAFAPSVGYCIGVVDLFLSKTARGDEKDQIFCIALLKHKYLRVSEALNLVPAMPDHVDKRRLAATIRRWVLMARADGVVIDD
jgi:hypothetical protein